MKTARDVCDLTRGSVECLGKQMNTNANQILRVDDMFQGIKATLTFLPPTKPVSQTRTAFDSRDFDDRTLHAPRQKPKPNSLAMIKPKGQLSLHDAKAIQG